MSEQNLTTKVHQHSLRTLVTHVMPFLRWLRLSRAMWCALADWVHTPCSLRRDCCNPCKSSQTCSLWWVVADCQPTLQNPRNVRYLPYPRKWGVWLWSVMGLPTIVLQLCWEPPHYALCGTIKCMTKTPNNSELNTATEATNSTKFNQSSICP